MVLPEAGAELGNNAVLSEVSTEDDCPQGRVHNLHLGFQVVFPSPCFSFAPDRMASLVIILQIALICIRRKEARIRFQNAIFFFLKPKPWWVCHVFRRGWESYSLSTTGILEGPLPMDEESKKFVPFTGNLEVSGVDPKVSWSFCLLLDGWPRAWAGFPAACVCCTH